MKASMKTLDNAINYLLPTIKEAKCHGVLFDRPTLFRMVADQYFIDHINNYNQLGYSYEKRMAYFFVADASKELSTNGFMEFGFEEFEFTT